MARLSVTSKTSIDIMKKDKDFQEVMDFAKMCPFAFSTGVPAKRVVGKGLPRDCQEDKCAWWTGTECAVLRLPET